MKKVIILKKGDRVRVTTDIKQLNKFEQVYIGKEAIVTDLYPINHRQIVKLDIDNGMWSWEFDGIFSKIEKI
jgi:hypothetical protein